MAGYDPRRSRPTPKVAPDAEAAPIDALLGPDPDPPDDPDPISTDHPLVPRLTPVRQVERAPSALMQMAPAIVVALIVVAIWLLRRNRR